MSPKQKNLSTIYKDDKKVTQLSPKALDEIISNELKSYEELTFTAEDKENMDVLEFWKSKKINLPYLYQAAMGLLHIPATSVPTEYIFSEAGYIDCARRSKILQVNLDRDLFLRKNLRYVPTDVTGTKEEIEIEDNSMHEN